jgi:outer membrane protein insertion porin family
LDRVIRRQFDAVEGDPFNDRLIRQAVDRIRAMGFFETVEANIRNGSAPDQRIVEIEVVEAPTGSLSFGGTYSTNDGVGALISYSERNFLGRGQTLKVDLTTAGDQREYGLTFVEPAFLARDVSLGLSARQFTSNNATGSYDVASTTLQASLGFQVSETGSLSTRVGLDTTEITDASAASVGQLISAEARRGSLSNPTLGYTYSYDSRRTGLNPNSGFVVSFAQDLGLGSDAQYVKSEFKSRAQTQVIGETVTLSAAFEAGNITYNGDEKSRVTERFALRSSQMRGFQNGGIGPRERDGAGIDEALGGTNYAVARFEARFPLGLPDEYGIDGGLFYDIGSLWGLDATNTNGNVLYDDVSWRQSAGASIFWDTPIGPLRFNFISPLVTEEFDKDQSFEFTISARF